MDQDQRVLNARNLRRGVVARRGDGSFGEIIPNTPALHDEGFSVPRGQIATIEIGVEVKIFAKAMIKQIGRVKSDMTDQLAHFRRGGGAAVPVCVGIVGVNHAEQYTSYERAAVWTTTGASSYRHPIQEAAEVIARLTRDVRPLYDEIQFLRYRATNVDPYPFEWVDYDATVTDYGALLVRVRREYEHRFNGHAPPSLSLVERDSTTVIEEKPLAADDAASYDKKPPKPGVS